MQNKIDPLSKADYYSRLIPFKLDAGKTYIIEMKPAPGSAIDPYLRLQFQADPVAMSGSGGGAARIVYRAAQTGGYLVIATTAKPGNWATSA